MQKRFAKGLQSQEIGERGAKGDFCRVKKRVCSRKGKKRGSNV